MKVLKNILIIFMSLCIVASLALTSLMFIKTQTLAKSVSELKSTIDVISGESEDVLQEDDVTIGGQYVIKSTKSISDAYISKDTSKLSDKDKETLDMASAVLDEIITDSMTDYEKELAVYDWMTSKLQFETGSLLVIPQTTADCDNPYGVLKYHNAVCVGYATTFRLFMQMLNIECMVVHDIYLSHSWDLVKLGDEWYHTDIYSDQGSGGYGNFNMNDSLCSVGHEWNTEFFPSANGLKYNHAFQARHQIADIYEIPSVVKELFENGISYSTAFEFSEKIDEDQAVAVSYMIDQLSNIADAYYYGISIEHSWVEYNDNYVLIITVTSYNDDPSENNPDDETMEAIDDIINSTFQDVDGYGDVTYDDDDDIILHNYKEVE